MLRSNNDPAGTLSSMVALGPRLVTVEGSTELLPFELDAPSSDAWKRALLHAAARAGSLAVTLGAELGEVVAVEERVSASAKPELRLAVTYALLRGAQVRAGEGAEGSDFGSDDILDYVEEEVRPLYAAFRSQLLEIDPTLKPRPAPLRKGKRRYEGFRRGGRGVIYAGFRRRGVRLQFELPEGHGVPRSEVIHHGRREFRVLLLTSATQVAGAIELARETLDGIAD